MSFPEFSGLPLSAPSATGENVRDAIAHAARATGVDFSYLLAQARLESGLNPAARAGTSSAAGLYQFTNATWAQTLSRHGADLGLDGAALADPAADPRLMALRGDPRAAAMMAADLAADNQQALTGALGRPPSADELYLAHFLGADGAVRFLSAMASDPGQSAAALLPRAAASNRAVFFDTSGAARSLGQVSALLAGRMDAAMRAGSPVGASAGAGYAAMPGMLDGAGTLAANPAMPVDSVADPAADPATGPIARQFAEVARQAAQASGGATGSMADTLRAAFGGDSSATPGFVRSAYGRMQALGL